MTVARRLRSGSALGLLASAGLALTVPTAIAQEFNWVERRDGQYDDAGNWDSSDVPDAPTETAVFGTVTNPGGVLISSIDVTVDAAGTYEPAAISFNGDTAYTLNGDGTLTLTSAAGVSNTSTVDQRVEIVLGESGVAAGLTQNGAGTLTLSAANTFTGATTVQAGTLALTGDGAVISSLIDIQEGALLTDGAAFSSTASVQVGDGAGTQALLDVDGNETVGTLAVASEGEIDVASGATLSTTTLTSADGAITVGSNGTFEVTGGDLVISDTVTLNEGSTASASGTVDIQPTGIVNVTAGAGTATLDANSGAPATPGTIDNAGNINVVNGTLAVGGDALNINGAGQLAIFSGAVEGTTTLTNNSTLPDGVSVGSGTTLTAGNIVNSAGATIANAGAIVTTTGTSNAGTINNSGDIGQLSNSNAVNNLIGGTITTLTQTAGLTGNSGAITNVTSLTGGEVENRDGGEIGTITQTGGLTDNQSGGTVTRLDLDGGAATNAGGTANGGGITTADVTVGTLTNEVGGTVDTLTQTGGLTGNSGTITDVTSLSGGEVENRDGGLVNAITQTGGLTDNQIGGTITRIDLDGGGVTNAGGAANGGGIGTADVTAGSLGNQAGGTINTVTQTGGFTANSGAITTVSSLSGGEVENRTNGAIGAVTQTGGLTDNQSGGSITRLDLDGGNATNAGGVDNDGGIGTADVTVGTLTNEVGGGIGTLTQTGGFTGNSGAITNVTSLSGGEVENRNGGGITAVTQTGGLTDNQVGGSITRIDVDGGGVTNAGGAANGGGIGTADLTAGTLGNQAGGSINTVTQTGGFTANSGTITTVSSLTGGEVENRVGGAIGAVTQTGGLTDNQSGGSITRLDLDGGDATNAGGITNGGGIGTADVTLGTLTNQAVGGIGTLTQTDGLTANSGTITNVASLSGGEVENRTGGGITVITQAGGLTDNQAGASIGTIGLTGGDLDTAGTIGTANIGGGEADILASGIVSTLTQTGGITRNAGAVSSVDTLTNGALVNLDGGRVTSLTQSGGVVENRANAAIGTATLTGGNLDNLADARIDVLTQGGGVSTNAGSIGQLTLTAGTAGNSGLGSIGSVGIEGGTLTNDAAVMGAADVTGGLFDNQSGTVGGPVTVSGTGRFDNRTGATVTGDTLNQGGTVGLLGGTFVGSVGGFGTFLAQGTFDRSFTIDANSEFITVGNFDLGGNAFTNAGTLNVRDGNFTGITTLGNSGDATISAGQTLAADSMTNTGDVDVAGQATLGGALVNAAGATFDVLAGGGLSAQSLTNAGAVSTDGTVTFASGVANSGSFAMGGNSSLAGGAFSNAGTLTIAGDAVTFSADLDNAAGATVNLGGATPQTVAFNGHGLTSLGRIAVLGDTALAGVTALRMENGSTLDLRANGAGTGERLDIGGDLEVGGQTITMDVNLANRTDAATNDLISVETVSGPIVFDLRDVGNNPDAPGFDPAALITSTSVIQNPSNYVVTGLGDAGLFNYTAEASGTDIVLNRDLRRDLIGGVVSGFVSAQDAISQAFFKPTGAFVSSPLEPEANQFGYAPFFRTNGGYVRVGSTGEGTFGGVVTPVESEVDVAFAGYQAGIDGGLFNIAGKGVEAHLGISAGQVFGFASQLDSDNDTRSGTTFVSTYAAVSKGRLFGDVQVRQEFTTFTIDSGDPSFPIDGEEVEATRLSVNVSGGYAFDYKDFAIVPAAGYTYARGSTDDLNLETALGTQTVGRVSFDDTESHIVFGGVSVGKAFDVLDERVRIVPFVTATLYHDFGESGGANLAFGDTFANLDNVIATTTQTADTYGELSFGARVVTLTPELMGERRLLSGNIRTDIQYGENKLGGAIDLQVRLQF